MTKDNKHEVIRVNLDGQSDVGMTYLAITCPNPIYLTEEVKIK